MFGSKTAQILVAVLGVMILAWAAYSYRTQLSEIRQEKSDILQNSQGDQVELVTHDSQESLEAVVNEPAKSIGENVKGRNIALEKQALSASTGKKVQDIIEDLYAKGFEKTAREMEGRLNATCFPGALATELESLGWLGAKIQKYCESVVISDVDYAETFAEFTSTLQQEMAELKFQFHMLSSSERNELLWEKIANASSWRELELLKIILSAPPPLGESNNWVHDLGQSGVFTGESGRDLQVAALQMYQCELLGSYCDSNSTATINQCYISRVCQPDWTMRDFYANTLSPTEFEQMEIVLEFLRSLGWGG